MKIKHIFYQNKDKIDLVISIKKKFSEVFMQNTSPMDWLLAQLQEECVFYFWTKKTIQILVENKIVYICVLSASETQVAGVKLGQMTHGGEE